MNKILPVSSVSMILAAILLIVINIVLTPFFDTSMYYSETATTALFVLRQSLSALTALLLSIGIIGLYLRGSDSGGFFGLATFLLAFSGSVFLFAHEWNQIFFVSELASVSPEILSEINNSTKSDIAALLSLVTFSLGYILFCIWLIRSKVYSRIAPILVISGFFAIPLFSLLFGETIGAILGNLILGLGFLLIGMELYTYKKN